jgi:hypothetical protein
MATQKLELKQLRLVDFIFLEVKEKDGNRG